MQEEHSDVNLLQPLAACGVNWLTMDKSADWVNSDWEALQEQRAPFSREEKRVWDVARGTRTTDGRGSHRSPPRGC